MNIIQKQHHQFYNPHSNPHHNCQQIQFIYFLLQAQICFNNQISMTQLNQSQALLIRQLQTLSSCTWQQQIQIIKSLKPTQQLIKLINYRNYSSEIASLLASHNPRSKLVIVVTDFIVDIFSNHANQLISFANLLVTNQCLIRLLGSGNKTIAKSINLSLKTIISNIDYKSKGKLVKFVSVLEQEFLTSKNGYIKQKISLYFLFISTSFYYSTKETLMDFQRKIVKEGLQDANQKVRANMKVILENIHHFEKENQFQSAQKVLQKHSISKNSFKNTKIIKINDKNKSLKVLNNSSLNQSSILQNFSSKDKQTLQKMNQAQQQSYHFYLQRLKNTGTWSMTILAYQSLLDMICKHYLDCHGNQQLYCETIIVLTPLLNQKRSKVFQSCVDVYKNILQSAMMKKKEKVVSFCQQNSQFIVQHAIKIDAVAIKLLPIIINLNPTYFLPKMCEITTTLKSQKQKLILLDAIVTDLNNIFQEHSSIKNGKRITTMIKSMCFHIEHSSLKDKQVSLASLAIISQLKSKYPQQVLAALLCQNNKVLAKILELAQSIDQSLKIAIIEYIGMLKSTGLNKKAANSKETERCSLNDQIQRELQKIYTNQSKDLKRLGELMLTHSFSIDTPTYKKIIGSIQFLCTSDLIMEFKILLEETARSSSIQFTNALIQTFQSQSFKQQNQQRQYHDLILIQLMDIIITADKTSQIQIDIIIKNLIGIYRESSSLKKRNLVIEILTKVKQQLLESELNEKQIQLIRRYRQILQKQERILQF